MYDMYSPNKKKQYLSHRASKPIFDSHKIKIK